MLSRSALQIFLFLFLFSIAFISCKKGDKNLQRSFYYWKSNEPSFDSTELKAIKHLNVKKLYVKFFEIENNRRYGVQPVSKTFINFNYSSNDSVKYFTEIVPVIFIKNEVLKNISKAGLDSLSDNILFLLTKKYKEQVDHEKSYQELQIDCDWTASTKDNYFFLLKALKKQTKKLISCTLRLYPYKYPNLMGVPPVDRATLMCYNLNNPLENENKNSILEVSELKKYLTRETAYPLKLDFGLPINSWILCFQNNRFTGILHNQNGLTQIAVPEKALWFRVVRDTVINDIFLREGDKIKYEEVSEQQLKEAVKLLKKEVGIAGGATISFFHLDKNSLNRYSNETLDYLYNSFE